MKGLFIWLCMMLSLFMSRASSLARRAPRVSRFFMSSFASSPSDPPLFAVHVKGTITPGEASSSTFYRHSLANARASVLEEGIHRFDVLRRIDEKANQDFLLIEVYKDDKAAPDAHKATSHYASWRDGVATLMAQPRAASKYKTIFPSSHNAWHTASTASNIDVEAYASSMMPWSNEPFAISSSSSSSSSSHQASRGLLAVLVDVQVKEGTSEAFIKATLANCESSVKEGGVTRFDLLADVADPHNFVLVEVYNNADAPAAHKQTRHYQTWAASVVDMMARPRSASKYVSLFPAPLYWHEGAQSTDRGVMMLEQQRGLTSVAGNAFGFLSPKLQMGRGIAAKALAAACKELGLKRPMIVTGKSGFERHKALFGAALGADYQFFDARFAVAGEPTVEDALAATSIAKKAGCDGVIAIGGGSAMDLGKAVSALLTNDHHDVYDYLEVIGKGMSIDNAPVPLIAIPTTAGTGSEATKNAVLKSSKFARKASIRHDTMLPRVAIIDPLLTLSCPPDVSAHVGLDTLCQVIEPFVSNAANPFTDALTKEAILLASRSLRKVVADGSNVEAREDMCTASFMGGLALANAKLGAVHGYAAVLGGMFEVAPHGAICAALLPHVFCKNAQKLAAAAASGDSVAASRLARFTQVARIVTGDNQADWSNGVAWLDALVKDLRVPGLASICQGLQSSQIEEIAKATSEASSTKGNPITLSTQELAEILKKAW